MGIATHTHFFGEADREFISWTKANDLENTKIKIDDTKRYAGDPRVIFFGESDKPSVEFP